MPEFQYKAILGSGRQVSGTVRSSSRHQALSQLIQKGYHPVAIDASRHHSHSVPFIARLVSRVGTGELAVFTRQLASLLRAGLPMVQALGTLRDQTQGRALKRVIEDLEEKLSRDAAGLSEAMEGHANVFNPVYRGLVKSGEESGDLPTQLLHLARQQMGSSQLRGQVIGAFVYPAFLVVLGFGAVFILMTYVIPRFQELFDSFEQELPWPTLTLIAISQTLAQWWWLVLLALLTTFLGSLAAMRRESVRLRVDRVLLALPVVGPTVIKVTVARVALTLGALMRSGIPVCDALRITRDTVPNLTVRRTFSRMIDGVSEGKSLADTFREARVFPPLVVNLVRTGEETGELSPLLEELADLYEAEARHAVAATVKLLEPVLIVGMGLVIAGIVAAVILPVFQSSSLVEM